MSSKNALNLFLVLVLTGLVLLAVYEPGKEQPDAAVKLTAIDPGTVQSIVIEGHGLSRIELQKISSQWQLKKPLAMPANAGRIQQLLKIVQATTVARYPMSQVNANQLRLDEPSLSLRLDDVLLNFGSTDALGGSRYVQVGDTVYLITDRYTHLARGSIAEFVSPALLPEKSIISELNLPGLRLTQQDGKWLANSQEYNADAVQSLLNEWRYVRALQVSLLSEDADKTAAVDFVDVMIGKSPNNVVIRFSVQTNETEILLQRQDVGIQYHIPLEAGQRLLRLSDVSDGPAL